MSCPPACTTSSSKASSAGDRTRVPSRFKDGGYRRYNGLTGVADILGILPQRVQVVGEGPTLFGNLLAVETKRPREKLRPEQEEFLRQVNASGGLGLCVHGVDELERKVGPFLSC